MNKMKVIPITVGLAIILAGCSSKGTQDTTLESQTMDDTEETENEGIPACMDYRLDDIVSVCYYGTDGQIYAMRFDHGTYDFDNAKPVWSSVAISGKPEQLFFFEDDTYIAVENNHVHVYQAAQEGEEDAYIFTERDTDTLTPPLKYNDDDCRTDVVAELLQETDFQGTIVPGYEWSLGSQNHALKLEDKTGTKILCESGSNATDEEGKFVPYEQKDSDTIQEDGVILTASVLYHFEDWKDYDIVYAASIPMDDHTFVLGLDSDGKLYFSSVDYTTKETVEYELEQPCPVMMETNVKHYFPEAVYLEDVDSGEEVLKQYSWGDYWIETSEDGNKIYSVWLNPTKANEIESAVTNHAQISEEELEQQALLQLREYVDISDSYSVETINGGDSLRTFVFAELQDGIQTGVGGSVSLYTDGTVAGFSFDDTEIETSVEDLQTKEQAFDLAVQYLTEQRPEFIPASVAYSESRVELVTRDNAYVYITTISGNTGKDYEVVCYVYTDAKTGELIEIAATDY